MDARRFLCVPLLISSSSADAQRSLSVSRTFQLVSPGRRIRPGSLSLTSTISMLPPARLHSSITTLSFSIGLKLHVEYTISPPTRSISSARHAI
jgi:hypothetical protein